MGRCKEIVIKVIPSSIANPFVKKHHYSGKVVCNSSLHFGAFLDGKLHGVLSYGPSTDKRRILPLVEGTGWYDYLELNRMAFDDYLPRNSESYCIGKTLRMIKKQAPQIKWVISFADGCSCGDGTIYRASNFILTGIKENNAIVLLPNGEKIHQISLTSNPTQKRPELGGKSLVDISGGSASIGAYLKYTGGVKLTGYQLRYIYFIDKSYRKRLTVPEIPFSKIDEMGAGMYKGENITRVERSVECEAQKRRTNEVQQGED
jgi:hypothetical protein